MDMRYSNAPAIEIHIEELVLRGFADGDRVHIGAAIEQELSRLIEWQGMQALPGFSANLEHLMAGSFRLANDANSQTIGRHIAQRIYRQLSPANISRSQRQAKEARTQP